MIGSAAEARRAHCAVSSRRTQTPERVGHAPSAAGLGALMPWIAFNGELPSRSHRILVAGTAGSGKSTLARGISRILEPRGDAQHHRPERSGGRCWEWSYGTATTSRRCRRSCTTQITSSGGPGVRTDRLRRAFAHVDRAAQRSLGRARKPNPGGNLAAAQPQRSPPTATPWRERVLTAKKPSIADGVRVRGTAGERDAARSCSGSGATTAAR
jgi:energy-coupling factor transporter ATP-binding protein EcfA2